MVVAAQEDGAGIGRIRLRQIVDASAQSLIPFVRESVVPGSTVHTDGWLGYLPLKSSEYKHEVTYLKGNTKTASELLPRVHLVVSHLKRWIMGTHQGAISHISIWITIWMSSRFASTSGDQKAVASYFSGSRSKPWQSIL